MLKAKRVLGALVALMVLLAPVSEAGAYEVAPMRITITPADGRSGSTITVNNVRDSDLPLEIKVKRRVIAEDGTQSFEPAEDDFVVFPPQITIPARQSQAFRFEYLGAPPAEGALAYVIEVAEVPVMEPGFSGVRFAYNFGVAVYVEPPKAFARLEAFGQIENGKLQLAVANTGTRFAVLTDMEMILEVGGKRRILSPSQLKEMIVGPLLAPGARRTLTMPVAELPSAGAVQVEFRQP